MISLEKALLHRILSAAVAISILLALLFFGGANGLLAASAFVILVALGEYTKMAFANPLLKERLSLWFLFCSCAFFILSFLSQQLVYADPLAIYIFVNALFIIGGLGLLRGRTENKVLFSGLTAGLLGLFYCVAMPFFALKILLLPNGLPWFGALLVIVFSGDTFAYFGGKFWGQKKLMPDISPKKTFEGSIAGIVGSCLSGLGFLAIFLAEVPWWLALALSGFVAVFAQAGDLLASLIKRVADVKDSGRLMPGHGGLLDRVDGIYLSTPIIYIFALYWS